MRIKDLVQDITQPFTQKAQQATQTPGIVLPGCLDGARGVMNDVVDAFDNAVGLDSPGAKPITFTAKDSDFSTMESKVAQMGGAGAPALDGDTRAKLDAGKIVANYSPMENGLVHERTMGVIDMPLDQFLQKMPTKDWGKNLAGWRGGEVKPYGDGKQVERMVLSAPGPNLDMTKVESLNDERDAGGQLQSSSVHWQVLKSDNGTVDTDIGSLRFQRYGDKTLVVFDSAHKLNIYSSLMDALPESARDAAVGNILTDSFSQYIRGYRAIAKT